MKDCPECGEHDSMYSRRDSHRCVNCGYVYKPKKVAHTVPTRSADAECGDIIGNCRDGVSRACVRKRVCADDTHCSMNAGGVKKLGEGVYMVVCGIHND
jgi:rubredoxin